MIAGMMALAGLGAGAAQAAERRACQVTVYLQDEQVANPYLMFRAKAMAAGMFAEIGIRLRWAIGEPQGDRRGKGNVGSSSPCREIPIRLVAHAAKEVQPGAWGYAFPYARSGVRVTLFYDRILTLARGGVEAGGILLAHVLAHEVAHMLQGIARHSEEGVMKAQWTEEDTIQMRRKPLSFASHDADLIHLALGCGDAAPHSTSLAAAAPDPASTARF
jgi:hypothetical protein